LIDESLRLCIFAVEPALRMLGGEIFKDRRRLPQDEAVLLQRRYFAVGFLAR